MPPDKKLKLGIDLSGGTILVYEVDKENLGPNFNMDELISALKHRVDPKGVKEIPIRKIGSNRIEIILPEAERRGGRGGQADAHRRRLARVPHPRQPQARRRGRSTGRSARSGLAKPPPRYKWARLGEISTGTNPKFTADTITDPPAELEEGPLRRDQRRPDRQGRRRRPSRPSPSRSAGTPPNTLTLAQPHGLKSITSYRIEYNPSGIRGGDPEQPPARRPDHPRGEGRPRAGSSCSILCNIDRQDVTGKYLSRVYATTDERLQPAVGFHFNRQGARRFGQLTREHLPEEGDAFKYQLAILLDNLVMSAPSINSEIRDSGDHRGGRAGLQGQGGRAPDQDPPGGQPAGEPQPDPAPGGEGRPDPRRGHDRQGHAGHLGLDARRADLHGHLLPVRRRGGGRRPGR